MEDIQLACRVRLWHIRQLYRFAKLGIYDDKLLLEVGWGFYARGQDILTVVRAYRGEVPCPRCQQIVYRAVYYRNQARNQAGQENGSLPQSFPCPHCQRSLTWTDCKGPLQDHPQCFTCQRRLDWNDPSTLTCSSCGIEWSSKRYRQSIRNRTRLPCPHCGRVVSRPKPVPRENPSRSHSQKVSSPWGELRCPQCKNPGVHAEGKFRCPQCGLERAWSEYVKRLKRRVERLQCSGCGHEFTWQEWRQKRKFLSTGCPEPVEDFVAQWPGCKTPQDQLHQIDRLLYALHGRGPMAHLFLEGDPRTIMGIFAYPPEKVH